MIRTCAGCGQERHIAARGLCQRCYARLRAAGRLDSFARIRQATPRHLPDWRRIAEDRKREIDRLRERIKELEHGRA